MAALYLHVPFRKPPSLSEASDVTATVSREIERYDRLPFTDGEFRVLYVGGGRPSLLSAAALRTLIENAREKLGATAIEEATLELHPSNASPPFLTALHELGITRLSIDGRSIGREKLRSIIQRARDAGFDRLSVDLSFGGAEQSKADWKNSLHRTMDLRVPHITLHERTPPNATDEDERADRFAFAMRVLDAKGYEQYELTHFARPGHRSHYQAHVYTHGNVLGLGPGAESFWWPDRSDPSTARRWSNVPDVATYVERLRDDASPVVQRENLDRRALAHEYILLRLRTIKGLDLDVLGDRYGFCLRDHRAATLNRLAAEELIHDDPDRVCLTPRGRLLADAVTQRLIRET